MDADEWTELMWRRGLVVGKTCTVCPSKTYLPIFANAPVVVHDRREALSAPACDKERTARWVEQVRICLGLDPSPDEAVFEAATRLALDVLGYVKKHGPNVDAQPWVERFLRDGTFEGDLSG